MDEEEQGGIGRAEDWNRLLACIMLVCVRKREERRI